MGVAELNRVKYTGLDFDTHFDDLQSRAQVKFAEDFNDFALSSLGIMLLDIVAFGLDSLSFYLDRRATDLYLETARTRKSVARLTRQVGYKMRAAIAASVDLDVSITEPLSVTVTVPRGFQFQGPNDLIFEAAQEVSWSPAEQNAGTTKKVPTYQGQTFTESFVSLGTANQVFELSRVPSEEYIVAGSVVVLVDGSQWDESEFITYDATDQYEIGYNDDPATIRFGDSVAGNIPTSGASIDVSYVTSRGKEGLVSRDTIQSEVNSLVVAFQTVSLSINNPTSSSGADDPEDLTHAKIFAGQVYKSRYVAVTRSDYEALAGSYADPLFGRVAVAQAISSRSSASDLVLQDLLADITGAVDPVKAAVDLLVASAQSSLSDATTELTTIGTVLAAIGANVSSIDDELSDAVDSARASKNKTLEITTDSSDIQQWVNDGKDNVDTEIDAITTGAANELDATTKAALKTSIKSYFDNIAAEATAIAGNASSIETSAGNEIASIGTARDLVVAIGESVTDPDSQLLEADTARQDAETAVTSAGSDVADIGTTVEDESETVGDSTQAIDDHFEKILAADCKVNLVTVPILTRDAGGFYTAPSLSLINSLQDYLDERKEVTQTVEVLSGESALIPAVVSIRVGVRTGYSESVTEAEVSTVVDGVLRDRQFGISLFNSDLVDPLLEVEGVSFLNVDIEGHTDGSSTVQTRLDTDGNLIIRTCEVITKGTVTIETEPVVQASEC
jgi:hypothetical protein